MFDRAGIRERPSTAASVVLALGTAWPCNQEDWQEPFGRSGEVFMMQAKRC